MPTYEWILFDADNTLLDFEEAELFALSHTLKEKSISYTPSLHQTYKVINHQCWSAFENGKMTKSELRWKRFELFLSDIGRSDVSPKSFEKQYLGRLSEAGFMIEGSRNLLEDLQGTYRLAIVTNGLKEVQRPRFRQAGIYDLFDTIIVSDEIGFAKPSHDFFQYTFEQINFPEKKKVVIVGDNLNSDIKGGNNFGISTCWYNYHQKENDTEVQPKYEAKNMDDLRSLFLF